MCEIQAVAHLLHCFILDKERSNTLSAVHCLPKARLSSGALAMLPISTHFNIPNFVGSAAIGACRVVQALEGGAVTPDRDDQREEE